MQLGQLLREARSMLLEASVQRAEYTADAVIASAAGLPKAKFITNREKEIPPALCGEVFSMLKRRIAGEPLAYILGEAGFYGRIFKVGAGCLIPRPETELLVEEMLRITGSASNFADWCTGSGCIGITLALENDRLRGCGIDSSEAALEWARINIECYGLSERFTLIKNAEPAEAPIETDSLDFVVANPPYIPTERLKGLMADVRDYEPWEALDGGAGGIDVYRKLFDVIPGLLKDGGFFGAEISDDGQGELLIAAAPPDLKLQNKIYDYLGILRHLIWRKERINYPTN